MNAAIWHRGPDDDGFYVNENVALGMRRLSIIDVAGGRQPIHNADKTKWIVYNGEIYNYQELRAGMEKRGHTFSTNSDTEVIVHLYDEFGGSTTVNRLLTHLQFLHIVSQRKHGLMSLDIADAGTLVSKIH